MVADDASPAVGKDRRQDRPAWPLRDLPDGRGGGAARSVPENSECDRRAPSAATGPMLRISVSDSRRVYGRETRAPKSVAVDRKTRHLRHRYTAGETWPGRDRRNPCEEV
jgi:hypothetical protein